MKYQALIDSSRRGIKGVRPTGHMVSSLPARDPAPAPVPSASTPAPCRFPPIASSWTDTDSPAWYSRKRTDNGGLSAGGHVPFRPGVSLFTTSSSSCFPHPTSKLYEARPAQCNRAGADAVPHLFPRLPPLFPL